MTSSIKRVKKNKPVTLKVIRGYDYTISIFDSKGKVIKFRDICGRDLELIEHLLESSEESKKYISFENIAKLLNLLSTENINFMHLSRRVVVNIFSLVKEHILCNYMTKYNWLSRCYAIQNGSFSGVYNMESVPMTKFVAMIEIHQQATESINKS